MIVAAHHSMIGGGRRLPYDAEVEYLESTGTQWIDTNVPGETAGLSLEARAMASQYVQYGAIFGSYRSENQNSFRFIFTDTDNGKAWATCGYKASSSHVAGFSIGDWHTIALDSVNDTCFVDGVDCSKSSRKQKGTTADRTIGVFALGSGGGKSKCRIAYLQMRVNNVLVRDLIPVRVGSEGCLYDRLGTGGMDPDGSSRTDGIYRNRGTGSFVVGADK